MRSLNKNISELESFINYLNDKGSKTPSIIGVTETWVKSGEEEKLKKFQLNNYDFLHCSRPGPTIGGGVGFYVKKDLVYNELDFKLQNAESKWLQVKLGKKIVIIGIIYFSEKTGKKNDLIQELDELLENVTRNNKKFILLGDMNIDLFSVKTTDPYYQMLVSNGVKCMVAFPTRETIKSKTLIDHILTNITDFEKPPTSGTIINDISDHNSTFVILPYFDTRHCKKRIFSKKVLSFKNYDPETAKKNLRSIDWSPIISCTSVNDAYNLFLNKLLAEQSRVIPEIEIPEKNILHQPWMTPGIRTAQKKRYKLYRKSKSQPNNNLLLDAYKKYRNSLCNIMRKAEKNYYSKLIQKAQGNQAKTWHIINDIMGRKKKSNLLPSKLVLEDGEEIQGYKSICDAFNVFFSTVGQKLASTIPLTNIKPEDYLHNISPTASFFLNPVTEFEVCTQLHNIDPTKTPGPDGLHPRYLKDIAENLVHPFTHIVNLSIENAVVPDEMKLARISPQHKTGDKEKTTNYRPISLLPILAKVLEGLIFERLLTYLTKNKILSDDQYGFRKGMNTKGALIKFINNVQNWVDEGMKTAAVFVDLKKAFDTVNYELLLKKLEKYGIRGIGLQWFKNYLNNRRQFVKQCGTTSDICTVTCGVPQGSNLGPLLFLLYINDLPDSIKKSLVTLFADDTTIYSSGKTYDNLIENLRQDLGCLETWFQCNKLTLNIKKSYGCIFGQNQKNNHHVLDINGHTTELRGSVKYLGVNVDSGLIWSSHISNLSNKISQTVGVLGKVKSVLNETALKTIYYSLIHSRLIYCIEIWGTAAKSVLQPLLIAQKKAVRIIVGAKYRAHTQPIFKKLGIRPVQSEIEYRHALLAYVIVKNVENYDIQLVIEQTHNYETRFASNKLPRPRKRTVKFGTRGLQYHLIKAYNSLPLQVQNRQPNSVAQCKKILAKVFPKN